EIGFAIGLKYTEGFSRLWPSVATAVAAAISLWLLTQALRTIPVGTAYAVWTGIGAVGVATVGVLVFAESASPARLACIALIVAGVVGLKLVSEERPMGAIARWPAGMAPSAIRGGLSRA